MLLQFWFLAAKVTPNVEIPSNGTETFASPTDAK